MRAGLLNKRITFEAKTETSDDLGPGGNYSWKTASGLSGIPAAVWPVSAREQREHGKLEMEITHQIRLRYLEGIDESQRIKWIEPRTNTTRYFNIVSIINPDHRNRQLDIMAKEIT